MSEIASGPATPEARRGPGSSRRSTGPLVGWGGGHPIPKNPPIGVFGNVSDELEDFRGPEICLECVGGRGSAQTPMRGAHDAPSDSLVGWEGPHPSASRF